MLLQNMHITYCEYVTVNKHCFKYFPSRRPLNVWPHLQLRTRCNQDWRVLTSIGFQSVRQTYRLAHSAITMCQQELGGGRVAVTLVPRCQAGVYRAQGEPRDRNTTPNSTSVMVFVLAYRHHRSSALPAHYAQTQIELSASVMWFDLVIIQTWVAQRRRIMRLCGRSKQMEQQSFYIEFHIRMQIDLNGSRFSSTKSLIRTLFTGNNTLIFGIRLTKVKRCISHFMFGVVHNCKHTAGDKDVLLTFYSAIYFVFYSIAVVLSSIPLYQRTAVGL